MTCVIILLYDSVTSQSALVDKREQRESVKTMLDYNTPSLSILIPYYNDEQFLETSIESVLNQTFKNFELILLDHASTDSSSKIAHSFSDPRIKHIKMPFNIGGGGGLLLKEFLSIAQGKYTKLFCADDVMYPNCLETLLNYLETNPDISAVFSDLDLIDEKSESKNQTYWEMIESQTKSCPERFSKKAIIAMNDAQKLRELFYEHNPFPYPSNMIVTSTLRTINVDNVILANFDYILWVQFLISGYKTMFVPESLVQYRMHAKQQSGAHASKDVYNRIRFERLFWAPYFTEAKCFKLIKEALHDSKEIKMLDEKDKDLYPFAIYNVIYDSHHLKTSKISAMMGIYHMMQNDELRLKIQRKFGFNVGDLRKMMSQTIFLDESDRVDIKTLSKRIQARIRRIINGFIKNKLGIDIIRVQ